MGLFKNLKSKMTGVPSLDEILDEVPAHIERFVGPVSNVFHEIVSDELHIDVHIVPSAPDRPYTLLFTTGMSMRAMQGPPPPGVSQLAELMVFLPPDWSAGEDFSLLKQDENYWPVMEMKKLARLPHEMGFLLREFISVPFDDPPKPAPGTDFGGFLATRPEIWPPMAQKVKLRSGPEIQLYALIPLTMNEMAWKAHQPSGDAFHELMRRENVNLLDMLIAMPGRASLI
jgi:hypothetical protein